ncbi:MAG TPA: D-alanyl-D-alanine carboxypeptidase/D-alanyl-D-alanine-endopeptidase [Tepidisphaeraceae bacterium]|jgi:D-alanyl-D-alanine carboxypeptidase/D-alanyl-D-alanine-endopeptidase (penicillin-binding protein 4)|nr:D-alanyl-D-alanine carboxypeptidase/D-alanyl-D-alanine-endopeptidase [Tepidisphaeraceae bacterium]
MRHGLFLRSILLGVALLRIAAPAVRADLQKDIQSILDDALLRNASVGIAVAAMPEGRELYRHNEHQLLMPASNMKILTTSAALNLLGADFKFRTMLVQRGDDLVLIGDGDPAFGDAELLKKSGLSATTVFEQWATQLKGQTFRHVLVDDSIFEPSAMHPRWDPKQFQNKFSAEVSGMTFNEGCVDLAVKSAPGGDAIYRMTPPTRYTPIRNTCVTGGRGGVIVTRQPNSNEISLRGGCTATEVTVSITVHDPALLAATVLAETLSSGGVRFTGSVGRDRSVRARMPGGNQGITVLAVHETALSTVLARANKDSVNLYAECLARRMGASSGGTGSWDSGGAAIIGFLKRIGIADTEFKVDDGCGLSREDRVSAHAMVQILHTNFVGRYRDEFMSSLAVGGKDGTLDNRFKEMRGRVIAKTGYIANVSALSGYLKGRDEQWYAFSILMNAVPSGANGRAKQLQEALIRAIDANLPLMRK